RSRTRCGWGVLPIADVGHGQNAGGDHDEMRGNEHVGFYGMDTAETEAFGELLGTDRERISSRIDELAGVIAGLDGFWRGPDASAFSSTWESLRGGAITSAL